MNSSDPLLRLNYAEFLDDTSKILKSNKNNTTIIYSGDITDLQSIAGCSVSFAGISYTVINKIKRDFDTHFFLKPWRGIKQKLEELLEKRLSLKQRQISVIVGSLQSLHDLGYLPVEVYSLDEGARLSSRQPCVTVKVIGDFYWLRAQLARIIVQELNFWQECTLSTAGYKKAISRWYSLLCPSNVDYTNGAIESSGCKCIDTGIADKISAAWAMQMRYTYNLNADYHIKDLYREADSVAPRSIVFCTSLAAIADTYKDVSVIVPYNVWNEYDFEGDYLGIRTMLDERAAKGLILGLHSGTSLRRKKYLKDIYSLFSGPDNSKRYKTIHPGLKLVLGGIKSIYEMESIFNSLHTEGFAVDNVILEVTNLSLSSLTENVPEDYKSYSEFTANNSPVRLKPDDKAIINTFRKRFSNGAVYRQFLTDVKMNLIQNL